MTTEQSIHAALKNFAKIKATGADAIIVRRPDHPHIAGDYFYAIRPADKHAWTDTEERLTADQIADLWYAAAAPAYHLEYA